MSGVELFEVKVKRKHHQTIKEHRRERQWAGVFIIVDEGHPCWLLLQLENCADYLMAEVLWSINTWG